MTRADLPNGVICLGSLHQDSAVARGKSTTVGRLNQIGAILGVLKTGGDDTLSQLTSHMRLISTPAYVDDTGCVYVSSDAPLAQIAAFLLLQDIDEMDLWRSTETARRRME